MKQYYRVKASITILRGTPAGERNVTLYAGSLDAECQFAQIASAADTTLAGNASWSAGDAAIGFSHNPSQQINR